MFFSHCHPSSVSVIYTLSLHDALPIFLDSFPLSLAYLITRVSSGALVQPASAATLVLGDMRCNSHASQFLDELPLVVSFICSQRDSPAAWQLFRHQQPGMTLPRTVGRGHRCVYHQSV